MGMCQVASKWSRGLGFAALLVTLAGCGSERKQSVKVNGESYPACSAAVISDYNVFIRSLNRALEEGISSSEKNRRVNDLLIAARDYLERHIREESCAAADKDGENVVLIFPQNQSEVESKLTKLREAVE